MNTENRDFVIERLERQLKEKETELDDIKNNLRESILREIRSDLKNDLDFNNRIAQLERKVQTLSSNLNGVMDELLDQKSMIRSMKEVPVPRENKVEQKSSVEPVKESAVPTATPKVYRPEPKPVAPSVTTSQPKPVSPLSAIPSSPSPSFRSVSAETSPSAKPFNTKVSIRSDESEPSSGNVQPASSPNLRFNVREVPSVKQPEMPEPDRRSEYIIAETDDERKLRIDRTSRQDRDSCKYIVAEEGESSCEEQTEAVSSKYETIEAREDEDAVVIVTRRK
ncbi:hypothetical protein RE476_09110 [Methanolobus mangrovi]|uniref:Uncharacterized protein n=1 Tax=Methanolobus mangrovi TaxID=3072977 RepID=A0AA51YIF8_9EURY|nr:hypothetical protein [Methanolobus mangrovi]WMW21545.1 hypothetical protein RE476_09110 [Methanolobus mangrovi]